jgi:hypothetical protein
VPHHYGQQVTVITALVTVTAADADPWFSHPVDAWSLCATEYRWPLAMLLNE